MPNVPGASATETDIPSRGNSVAPQADAEHSFPNYPDTASVDIIFDLAKGSADLQVKIAERMDVKAQVSFGFGLTVFGITQAFVLRKDTVDVLSSAQADWINYLSLASVVAVSLGLLATVVVLVPRSSPVIRDTKLRELLMRADDGDRTAGTDGVNLLLGQASGAKAANASRYRALVVVIGLAAVSALLAVAEITIAVMAAT